MLMFVKYYAILSQISTQKEKIATKLSKKSFDKLFVDTYSLDYNYRNIFATYLLILYYCTKLDVSKDRRIRAGIQQYHDLYPPKLTH